MQWFILSRDMHVLAMPSTDAPKSLPIFNDKQMVSITNNTVVSTYDFSVQQKHPDAGTLQMGNYIAFRDKYNKMKLYTLINYDGDDLIQTWHAEDIGLDLLNETADKWDYTGEPHDIAWYLDNLILKDTGWSIGFNEIGNLTRALKFEGQSDTLLKRLGDVANQFDGAEIDFTIEMESNHVTRQVINIHKKIGSPLIQDRYIDSVNLKSLKTSGSIANLCTSMIGYGSQPDPAEGQDASDLPPIDFSSISYDDGQFYSPVGDKHLYDRVSHLQWSRFKAFNYANQGEFDGYINGIYTYDTKDPQELLNRTLMELKKRNHAEQIYEADLLSIGADVGDYVQIAHNNYNPPIYLQARIESVTNCYTAKGQDTGVLGDYTLLESEIDPRVKDMLDALKNQIKGNFTWTRYAEDANGKGMTAAPNIRTTHVAFLSNQKTGVPSDNPADYAGHWVLIKGPKGDTGDKGADGEDGVAGKDGVGVKLTTVTYQASTSGTTAPTGAWIASPTAVAGQYQWTRTVWTYTDGTTEVGYSVGHIGADGATGKDGVAGKPGVGIKSTTITYQASTSGTTVPTGAWVSSPPSVPGGNYLWTRTVWSYTDSTSETGYSIAKAGEKGADGAAGKDGVAGKDGLGIKSTVIAYQLSSSGTTTPTGTWSATVPALVKGQYLWTRTTLTYTDNSSEPVYSVSYVAKDGNNGANGVAGKDGVGIETTSITYATSTSGTSAPTSGWVSAPPSAAAGQFIWTRTIWTYTDNTTETGYSVGKIGEKGDKGDTGQGIPGLPGADGRTPYLHTAWANSFDGKDGFSTDVSTNKSYMGTYVNFTEADPTDPALYNWIELVGALVIGGRNYLLNTNTPSQMQGSGGTGQGSWTNWLFTFGTIKQAPFNDGDYVTVSFDYINVGTGAYGTISPQFNETPWGGLSDYLAMKDNGHVVRTVQWKSGWTTSGTATGIQIRMDNVATTRTVTVYNMQFESGNKATDHKVAPEDTQALIDSLSTPNLVYNAGLQGSYKNGLDGWTFIYTIPDKWYKSSQPSSMIDGINALAINGSLPENAYAVADSKPMAVQAGNVVSAGISMKIGTDSGSSILTATEIHFTNDSGAQVGSNVQIGSVNNKTDYASFEIVNVSVPTGATRIGIRCYARNDSSTSAATVHAFWCKPTINYGTKVAIYSDNQGSGADISQTNDALIALNDVFDKTVVPVASITAPPNPKEGQGWWVLNSSQQMIGFKIYKNGKWADAPIQQSAMNIGTLNGNIINGATINSSNFNVAFDETMENTGRVFGPYFKGTQVIKNGSYLADYQYKGTTQTGFTHLTPDGLQSQINNSDGSLLSQVTIGMGGLSLQNATHHGDLYPEDVERTAREGWITNDGINGNNEIGFMKQFRRVWLDGVVVLKPASFPHYQTLFKLKNKALWPPRPVYVSMNELGSSPSTVATLVIDAEGLVQIVYSGNSNRYIAEGHFYLLD